jgi:hypothetical protein
MYELVFTREAQMIQHRRSGLVAEVRQAYQAGNVWRGMVEDLQVG